jgi:signal peptidase I
MEILKYGDIVTFTVGDFVLNYQVRDDHMNYVDQDYNYIVFEKLGLSEAQKKDLATHYYGYTPTGGDWPYYRRHDYAAATELVKAVHDLCNKYNSQHK